MLFPDAAHSTSPLPAVITVGELNRQVKQLVEQNFALQWVSGEISNLTRAASGHWYFSLKDATAQVRCVMFRHKNATLDWMPTEGAQVEVRAQATLYEARGDFQLTVETMRRAGLGALYEAYEKLKAKLNAEGLFDPARKKPLPSVPKQIGVITSTATAAIRDVLTTLARRMPNISVIIYPTPVQGEGAAEKIAAAIYIANKRSECDVLILCRGGGSIEDLWQFNDERVARAIAHSHIPIVCGVGHETDFTIADFVADLRAPTPTAAAELITPNGEDLRRHLAQLRARANRQMQACLETHMQRLDHLARLLLSPTQRLQRDGVQLTQWQTRLRQAMQRVAEAQLTGLQQIRNRFLGAKPSFELLAAGQQQLAQRLRRSQLNLMQQRNNDLKSLKSQLAQLNPQAVLERGYSLVHNARGEIIRSAKNVKVKESVRITFADGNA
ncbi:MAG: exodeoxyribonuclease VII large subunit, partial [Burkholderiales bacterium]